MVNSANHYGSSHKKASARKQFFRIRGESRIRWIGNENDWKAVHLTGVPIVCPDQCCGQPIKANQRTIPRLTRYLSDMGDRCSHFVPDGGAGRMTDEHMWLQGKLRDLCEALGFPARLEQEFADVRVDFPTPYALEVQRVSTDFSSRTAQRARNGMNTVWFLPETEKQRNVSPNRRGDPVFEVPAVRLRYYRSGEGRSTMLSTQTLQDRVWNGADEYGVELRVAVTIWQKSEDGRSFHRLQNNRALDMDLRDFLREVLSGERRWFNRQELHGPTPRKGEWAGWAKVEEVREVQRARTQREVEADRVRQGRDEQTRDDEGQIPAGTEQEPDRSVPEKEPTPDELTVPLRQQVPPAPPHEPASGLGETPASNAPWWKRLLRQLSL